MKKHLLVSLAALSAAFTFPATAADLPSRKAADLPPPPSPMWTGFYVGLNAGGTWANSNRVGLTSGPFYISPVDPPTNRATPSQHAYAAAIGASGSALRGSQSGFIAGGQVGYNWQAYNIFVVGLEADIQGVAGSRGAGRSFNQTLVPNSDPTRNITTIAAASKGVDYIGTVRGRVGYLVTPYLFVFGTGGLAYGGTSTTVTGVQSYDPVVANRLVAGFNGGAVSNTQVGWAAGGGAEWMFMSNWSAKLEYIYYDLNAVQFNVGTTSVTDTSGIYGVIWANAVQAQARFNGNIVRAAVNYHFNWAAAPVVASY